MDFARTPSCPPPPPSSAAPAGEKFFRSPSVLARPPSSAPPCFGHPSGTCADEQTLSACAVVDSAKGTASTLMSPKNQATPGASYLPMPRADHISLPKVAETMVTSSPFFSLPAFSSRAASEFGMIWSIYTALPNDSLNLRPSVSPVVAWLGLRKLTFREPVGASRRLSASRCFLLSSANRKERATVQRGRASAQEADHAQAAGKGADRSCRIG
eukprot:scaffold13687_cov125-Isochrysis_galbana.AAC.2